MPKKTVKFSDKKGTFSKRIADDNSAATSKAKQTLTNVTLQTQEIKNLMHFTSEDEDSIDLNLNNEESNWKNTVEDSSQLESRTDKQTSYITTEDEACDICPGNDTTSFQE